MICLACYTGERIGYQKSVYRPLLSQMDNIRFLRKEDVQAGVKIINVHHANEFNPYINYPFLTNEKLKAMVKEWHGKGVR